MSSPYIGEIRLVPYNFAPQGWAFCDGQLLSIAQNDALFNLIGTTYGGDGQTTFALPDLRGRVPIHQGNGSGLSPRVIGQNGGVETVTLTVNQIPQHTHAAQGTTQTGNQPAPAGNIWAASNLNEYTTTAAGASMNAAAIGLTGGSQAHENRVTYLALHFILSLFGIFPSQN